MNRPIRFSKSTRYTETYGDLAFGLTLISGCSNRLNPPGFDQYKRKRLRQMRRRERLQEISERIEVYDRFFKSFGHECPLPAHLKRTINSGFPRYNLMVDAHFMAEMCAGILVAVTDYDRFQGGLTLDLAQAGESCQGMGGRDMVTGEGEIVLRDEQEIVCVLCQGADEKTRVREETKNVLFYAYSVPGIAAECLKEGLEIAAEAVQEFGGGTIESLEVYA
ncbi:MAG: phenylalanine--tRNA ligase beta subunit-related protein [Desulfobacteraceae bacterium]